jgi:uncharacterized protein (DUF362 family)
MEVAPMSQPPRNRKERRALQRHAKARPRKAEHWMRQVKRDREVQAIIDDFRAKTGMLVIMDEIAGWDTVRPDEPEPLV